MLPIEVEGMCLLVSLLCENLFCSPLLLYLLHLIAQDLNQLRDLSLGITDHAIYRLQIQLSASQVFFSYLPVGMELQLTTPMDVNPSEYDAKRPLDAGKIPLDEANQENMVVEPEQKRMKTEE